MKKFYTILILSLLFLVLTGCNKNTTNNTTTKKNDRTSNNQPTFTTMKKELMSLDEVLSAYSKSMYKCDSYSLTKYMKPVWESQIIYNETLMFFEEKDGTIKDKALLYPIAKILEVRDNTLSTLYEEGKDYSVVDGKLHYLDGSNIYLMKYDEYYLDRPNNSNAAFSSVKEEGKYYYYSEGDYFSSKQVSVTYIRTTEWEGPTIKRDKNKLPKTMEKLNSGEALRIVFYGDSIMEGCNASSFNKVEPNMPTLSKLVTKKLVNYFENPDILEINTAVGGWSSANGVMQSELDYRVIKNNPDLVVIAFGANDATFRVDKNTFGANIQNIMKKVLQSNPNCEFILVSSPRPNTDAVGSIGNMAGNVDDFVEVLSALSEEDNVAFADMTTMSEYLYSIKDFYDMTGNNINHPSDFLIRVEAQLICSVLID